MACEPIQKNCPKSNSELLLESKEPYSVQPERSKEQDSRANIKISRGRQLIRLGTAAAAAAGNQALHMETKGNDLIALVEQISTSSAWTRTIS